MIPKDILETALKQSAADCSCSPEDFLRTEHVVTEALPSRPCAAWSPSGPISWQPAGRT